MSLQELLDVRAFIDRQANPQNYANLQKAIAAAEVAPREAAAPKPIYASFWQRFGAYWLDFFIFVPLIVLIMWGDSLTRMFRLYEFIPGLLFGLWYHVYLVRRYGGTPGKLLMRIRIVRTDETRVAYKEAFLRYVVMFVFAALSAWAMALAALGMSDAEYFSLDWAARAERMAEFAPSWYGLLILFSNIWVYSEFIVMLTNRKRRAIHDFMAGTIVIREEASDLFRR